MKYLFVQKDDEKNIIVCGYVDIKTWSSTQASWSISKRLDPNDPTLLNGKGYEMKWVVDPERRWFLNNIYPVQRKYYRKIFREIFK